MSFAQGTSLGQPLRMPANTLRRVSTGTWSVRVNHPTLEIFVRTYVVFVELPWFSQKQINLWEDKRQKKKKSKWEYLVSGPFSEAKGSQDLKLLNSPPPLTATGS